MKINIPKISYYYFNPFHQDLPEKTRILRLVGVIAAAIFSAGIIPAILAIFYSKKFVDLTHQDQKESNGVKEVFEKQVINPNTLQTANKSTDVETQTNTQSNLKSRIINLLKADSHLAENFVDDIFELIENEASNISKAFEDFSNKYEKHIQKINDEGGWELLKSKLNLEMGEPYNDSISFKDFRDEVNQFVVKQVNDILSLMGIGKVSMIILGTPGWNSDVDIGFRSQNNKHSLTTEEMVMAKILCELATMQILGKFPGPGLDTEWYVDLNFLADNLQTDEAKRDFYTIDFIMSVVQAFKSLSEGAWANYCERELLLAKNETERELLTKIFDFIELISKERKKAAQKQTISEEQLTKCITNGAGRNTLKLRKNSIGRFLKKKNTIKLREVFENIQDDNGEKKYNGQLLSNYSYLLDLAKQCSLIEKTIHEISLNEDPDNVKLDNLRLEHDILFSLVNASQPESMYSHSGINSTLFGKRGQKYQRILEQKVKEFGKSCKDENGPLSEDKVNVFRDQLEETIQEMLKEAPELNASQLLVAIAEQLAQYQHVLEKNDDIIEASKYLLRIAEGLNEALEIAKKNNVEIEESLLRKVNKLNRLATRLEKCKRKFAINDYVARSLLLNELGKSVEFKKEELENELKIIFREYDQKFRGRLYKKSEKLSYLANEFKNKFNIKITQNKSKIITGNKRPVNDEIFQILQAFVGYSRQKDKHENLRQYHGENSNNMTRKHHQNLINEVKDGVHNLCIEVRHFMRNSELAYGLSEKAVDFFVSVPNSYSESVQNL